MSDLILRAISLWQPWASLWVTGKNKRHETRCWPTRVTGTLAVHAAQRIVFDLPSPLAEIVDDEFGGHWGIDLPRGAIIGTVSIVECLPVEIAARELGATEEGRDDIACGDFTPGRYAIKATDFRPFRRPVPWKGRQRFFNVPMSALPELDGGGR